MSDAARQALPQSAPTAANAATTVGAGPRGTVIAVLAIGVAEAAAAAITLRTMGVNLTALAAIHAMALLGLTLLLRAARKGGRDTSVPLLALIGTFAVGPAGALGAAALGVLSRSGMGTGSLIDDWYERISLAVATDPVNELCDNVAVGRTLNLAADAPISFQNAIVAGTLAERQAVLGLIARHFHTDYLPVLSLALKSEEPVIRVQAAAVAAHVRPQINRLYRECADGSAQTQDDPKKALALLRRLTALMASGLLDEVDRLRGAAIVQRLGDIAVARTTQVSRDQRGETREDSALVEQLLIERQRFCDLRMRRSRHRVLDVRPAARVRRLGQPAGGTELEALT